MGCEGVRAVLSLPTPPPSLPRTGAWVEGMPHAPTHPHIYRHAWAGGRGGVLGRGCLAVHAPTRGPHGRILPKPPIAVTHSLP